MANDDTKSDSGIHDYKRQVFYLALDLTGNHHDAEDLTQEAFLSAYRGFKRFRGRSSVWTWLYRITVNTHISRSRKKAAGIVRQAASWDDPQGHLQDPIDSAAQSNPERQIVASGIQERLERALRSLSDRERTVFILRHFQNLKIREIADLLLLNLANIDTRADGSESINLAAPKRVSRELLEASRQLKEDLAAASQPRLVRLVGDLEKVMLQVTNLEERRGLRQVRLIQKSLQQSDLLLRVNLQKLRPSLHRKNNT